MINKLIILADELDKGNFKEAADFVDNLLKTADDKGEDGDEEWGDVPTKVDTQPMPPSVPALDPDALEIKEVMSGLEIARDLRSIFTSLPNPDKWEPKVKEQVVRLFDKLREIL